MKAMKIALLGTAALAAASVSARADNLDALKAQIEALNARVAQLETAPAVPAGYQMVSFSKGKFDTPVTSKDYQGADYHIITVLPTADAPAAASTVVAWSGYVRAAIVSVGNSNGGDYSTDVRTKAGFNVTGKTDTAVGEVGVSISTQATYADGTYQYNAGNGALNTDGFSGWWKFAPNLTLTGGLLGTLAKSGYTFDANCTCAYTDPWGAIFAAPSNDPAAMRLGYADGPLSFAVQLEDANNSDPNSAFGVSAKAGYKADMVSFDIAGGYWGNATGGDAAYSIAGGIGLNFAPVTLGVSVGTAHTYGGADIPTAGGYATVALGDAASLELGVTHDFGTNTLLLDSLAGATTYDAGLYYTPVNKLKFGLEGAYQSGGSNDTQYTVAFVSWFKF